eukprot:4345415-Prymnesium_polylepis.1
MSGRGQLVRALLEGEATPERPEAAIAWADHKAVKFFGRHGFNDDPILCSRYREISEPWDRSILMSAQLPPPLPQLTAVGTDATGWADGASLDDELGAWRHARLLEYAKELALVERLQARAPASTAGPRTHCGARTAAHALRRTHRGARTAAHAPRAHSDAPLARRSCTMVMDHTRCTIDAPLLRHRHHRPTSHRRTHLRRGSNAFTAAQHRPHPAPEAHRRRGTAACACRPRSGSCARRWCASRGMRPSSRLRTASSNATRPRCSA